MSHQETIEKIIALSEPVVSSLGLCLVDVRFAQLSSKRTLEVTIFRPGGRVGLADCQLVSSQMEELLEKQPEPLILGSYLLEVQSPGIDRPIKSEREFKVFAGQTVEIELKEALGSLGRSLVGTLAAREGDKIKVAHPRPRPVQTRARSGTARKSPMVEIELPAELVLDAQNLLGIKLYPEDAARVGGRTVDRPAACPGISDEN